MAKPMRDPVCPRFHQTWIGWYDVQGYCVPPRVGDRPRIPTVTDFETYCASPRFEGCPTLQVGRRFIGDNCPSMTEEN